MGQRAGGPPAASVIASVNPSLGPAYGDTRLHVTEIDAFVPEDRPGLAANEPPDAADEGIAYYTGLLVGDGDTVQGGRDRTLRAWCNPVSSGTSRSCRTSGN